MESWVTAAVALVFVVLTVVAVVRMRDTGRAGCWASAMFGSLAVHLGAGWLTELLGSRLGLWPARLSLAVLLLFPVLVLAFAGSFRPVPRRVRPVAAAVAAGVVVTTALVPSGGDERPAWVTGYLAVVLLYWTAVSAVAAALLWRAGRGQPRVARRRMRLMSVATSVLALGLLLSGMTGGDSDGGQLLVLSVVLLSGVLFAVGFRPPRALVLSWRQPEDRQLRRAMMDVLRAGTSAEVTAALLPPVTRIVGGSGAALLDADHRVVTSHGRAPAAGTVLPSRRDDDDRGATQRIALGGGRGELVVWTSPSTPFFAREEIDLLRTMGAFASLALERSELLLHERTRREALQEAQAEAERARDEADRSNTAKSEFLSRMSHELRTPLNAVLGFGQLLELSPRDEEDREAVGHILKAGRHLLALIDDVLDLSRIDAGTMTISLEPVSAAELVDDAVALIRPLADSRSISLASDVADCGYFVRADRQRSRQVLLNLLSNAVKYNHDGGAVTVRCARRDGVLRLSVSDTGPGIDVVRQQRLFEPFDRLGAESSGVEGTGLGLALTRQLVQAMSGSIGVESTAGEGATFWFDLPLAQQPATEAAADSDAPAPAAGSRSRTLLLVEDNLTNLRLVEAMLRRRPEVAVLPAMHGQLAIDLARQHSPDVVVLDLHLPDLSGRQILHRLQADPRTRGIPVVIASADATQGRVRQLREEGAFDYITKPLDVQVFLEAVDGALTHSDEQRQGLLPAAAGGAGASGR